jgi:hypothetical protein
MMQDVLMKLNPGSPSKSDIQNEEGCFHQQIGLKFEEETSEMLHFKHSTVW